MCELRTAYIPGFDQSELDVFVDHISTHYCCKTLHLCWCVSCIMDQMYFLSEDIIHIEVSTVQGSRIEGFHYKVKGYNFLSKYLVRLHQWASRPPAAVGCWHFPGQLLVRCTTHPSPPWSHELLVTRGSSWQHRSACEHVPGAKLLMYSMVLNILHCNGMHACIIYNVHTTFTFALETTDRGVIGFSV